MVTVAPRLMDDGGSQSRPQMTLNTSIEAIFGDGEDPELLDRLTVNTASDRKEREKDTSEDRHGCDGDLKNRFVSFQSVRFDAQLHLVYL